MIASVASRNDTGRPANRDAAAENLENQPPFGMEPPEIPVTGNPALIVASMDSLRTMIGKIAGNGIVF
jgi:hypothetical protein